MKKALSVMLTLAISTAAAEPLLVSLDPLPYGAIQLAFNQYLIPNVGGMNVLLYSDAPLTFAQPGQSFTPKTTLSLSPLPFGAVRMNDSQYMIPAVMPGVMALVVSAKPLSFAASPLALQNPSPKPTETAVATLPPTSPAPAIAAVEAAKSNTAAPAPTATLPQPPTAVTAVAVPVENTPAAPLTPTNRAADRNSALSAVDAPKPAPVVTTETPKPTPGATTEAPKPAPVTLTETPKPTPVITTETPKSAPAATLTTEVKASTRLPRLPGLPDDLTGNITITQHSNTVTFSYTLTSLGTTTYILNPTALRLTQDGLGIRARLDRRNGNLTPGTLAPGKGEIGTITVNRTTSADVQLTWLITDNAGHTYTLNATAAQQPGDLGIH